MVPTSGVYNVNAAVHNANGGVYKVNEQLLTSLSTRVNKTHATFTNVNAPAPNAGGNVSQTSQVRSTYFRNHSTQPEAGNGAIVICDGIYRWSDGQGPGLAVLKMRVPLVATKGNDWVPERLWTVRKVGPR